MNVVRIRFLTVFVIVASCFVFFAQASAEPLKESVDRSVVVMYESTVLNAEQVREIENMDSKFAAGVPVYNRILNKPDPVKVITMYDRAPVATTSSTKPGYPTGQNFDNTPTNTEDRLSGR